LQVPKFILIKEELSMKKDRRRLSKGVLAALLCATILSGCGAAGKNQDNGGTSAAPTASPNAKAITIKVGSVVAATHPMNVALKSIFKPLVEEGSGGALKVEVYDGGVLGGEKELYDSVRNGNLQIVSVGTVMWNEIGKMSIPDWPFLFRDLEHAKKVYTGDIGKEIAADVEKGAGIHFLSWHPNGVRVFSSNKTIETIDKFKGLRLRMPNNPIHIQVGKLLGANVTPMPLGEVFTALEQKVVDGQDNPLATFKNEGWYEVQTDIFESNHMITSLELLASDKLWKDLTEEQRKLIQDAALKTSEESWNLYAKSIDEDKKFLQEKGIKFTTPDDAVRQKLIDLMQPVYDDLYKKYPWAKEMVEKVRSVK
jgi:TRAP-type transport system periplasmic protein